jgi:hypothetical protein
MPQHNPEILAAATESITRRHHDYLVPIQNNHSLAKTAADRLKVGGEIEQLLKELGCHEPEWLQAQRQRLLQLGASNDERTYQVGAFVTAVRDLGSHGNNNSETHDDDDEEEATSIDYEQLLQQGMQDKLTADKNSNSTNKNNHDKAKEIRSKLEMPPEEQDLEAQDQELQVVGGHAASAVSALKCPLTGTLLEDPVKNSVCGHAYSKAAILDHLRRAKGKVCPMVGCHNRRVTMDQLVPDLELTQLVRRHKRRSDANQEHLLTQVLEDDDSDLDDDDDDNDENHDGNTMTRAMKREESERM